MTGSKLRFRALFIAAVICLLQIATPLATLAAPENFGQARRYVYHDRTAAGTIYCGCEWGWVGRSGGRVDLDSCGYEIRSQEERAKRIEWEHIVPASVFGRDRPCWQDGGRENCNRTDPIFNLMEADLHNLAPAVGEVNANRSNYRFEELPNTPYQHGACDFKVDSQAKAAEPRDQVKGKIARVYFYMHDRYLLPMDERQQRMLLDWHGRFPPTEWELERDRRIAARMGHNNPFVTGDRFSSRPDTDEEAASPIPAAEPAPTVQPPEPTGMVRGNRNSKVYHLPVGCPSYGKIAPGNIVEFADEQEAIAAGYRKAGNCR